MAIGSEPKILNYPALDVIELKLAMDKSQLKSQLTAEDTIAVFGSSHSAILIIRHLIELGVTKIINFYRNPLKFAIYYDDWILYDNTGLKGTTANWARENIEGQLPQCLQRYKSTSENIERYLPECNKVIYAVGFQRRELPMIDGLQELSYDEQTGQVAPGLYGAGIAFPEGMTDRAGNYEHRVGLWKFMDYLQRAVPQWIEGSNPAA